MSFRIVTSLALLIIISFIGALFLIDRDSVKTSLTADPLSENIPLPNKTNEDTNDPIKLAFVGDIMLDRNIRLAGQRNGYQSLAGPDITTLLQSQDLAVGNLEGPVTTNTSVSVGSAVGSTNNFIFTFSPESLVILDKLNISVVNLGNNHILNFGETGLTETYQQLDKAGLDYFGFTSESQPTGSRTYSTQINDTTIGFVNYNQFIPDGESAVMTDIAQLESEVDILVVYTHWGNEYVPENQVLINLAHQFIDTGADLVIGSHPHVVTGHEVYQGKHIYYALGNFIFDQYFEAAVREGQVVLVEIDPTSQAISTTEEYVAIESTGVTELRTATTSATP